MRLSIIIYFLFVLNVHSQTIANLGPFNSRFPDPLSKSQEKRATSVDKQMLPKVTLMAGEIVAVRELVVDYENSLSTINPALIIFRNEVKSFLDECIDYIFAKKSISGNIPGLSKLAKKMTLIAYFQIRKINTLKDELEIMFRTDNFMTEGERKMLVLGIIDRALKITL